MQKALFVVKPEQQRADQAPARLIAEAADHAVRRAQGFDFEAGPDAAQIRQVEPLGDDTVAGSILSIQPTSRDLERAREGRQRQSASPAIGALKKRLERGAAFEKRRAQQWFAARREQAIE